MDRKGNQEIQLQLFYNQSSNPPLYPQWQAYLREHQPPTLVVWGKNDEIFQAEDAHPYKRDLLLHDVEDHERVERLIPKFSIQQSTQPFMAPAQLNEEKFGSLPKFYIQASLDKVMSLSLQDAMISNWKVQQVSTLESGHFPLTSIPDRLVEVIKNFY